MMICRSRRMMMFVSMFFLGVTTALSFRTPTTSRRARMTTRTSRRTSSSCALNMALDMEHVVDSNYRQVFKNGNGSNKAVLLDCAATWCGPCKLIEPVLERAQEKWSNQIDLYKFNIDDPNIIKDTKLELVLQGVMPQALPSLILFHDGKAIANHKGVITDDELDDFIENNLPIEVRYNMSKNTSNKAPGFVSFASKESDDYMLSAE